ncbi:MAG: hypothetical protein WC790_03555 [Candidatus Paceibacterota bacterium]
MANTQTDIERIVMRRVHLIRILKLVISTAVFALLTFVAALWGIGKEVWVARVFENAPSDIGGLLQFYIAAFAHTHIIVQALTVLTFASFLFLAREVARLALNIFAPARS